MSTDNTMQLWDSVRTPDPAFTKAFSRGGGFRGTATNALYLIREATRLWGPMGGAWGVSIVSECYAPGAPLQAGTGTEVIHVIRIELHHPGGKVPGIGQTVFVGSNKNGVFTDEEAPKKSLTDAVGKALSWLGFAADVHMGLWDDSKYVNDVRKRFEEKEKEKCTMTPSRAADWLQAIASADQAELAGIKREALDAAQAAKDREAWIAFRDAANARAAELTGAAA